MTLSLGRTETSTIGGRTLGGVVGSLLFIELFSGVLQTYFTPVYRALAGQYGVSLGTISWAQIAPTLALVIVTPALAGLGDLHGHRRILRVAVGMAACGSILVAIAPSFAVLLVGRVLQGAIGSFLPLMFGLLRDRYDDAVTRPAIGYLCAVLMIGALAGTTLSGPLAQVSLHWPLWVTAAGLTIGFLLLMTDRAPAPERLRRHPMDWTGALLLAAGLAGLVLGIDKGANWGYGDGRTLGCLAFGLLVLAAWVVVELRAEHPLMDLRYLLRPRLVPTFLVGFLMYFAFLGSQVPNATFMSIPARLTGYGLGLSSAQVSLALVIPFAVMALTASGTARVARQWGYPRVVALGCVLFGIGAVALIVGHGTLPAFIACYALVGAGFGFVEGGTRTMVVSQLAEQETSVGVGIYELSIGVGSAIGAAVAGAALTANVHAPSPVPSEHGYVLAWTFLAVAAVAGAAVAMMHARTFGRQENL